MNKRYAQKITLNQLKLFKRKHKFEKRVSLQTALAAEAHVAEGQLLEEQMDK
jgi:hypothetical protein